jgi:hypothetical protein
MSQQRKNCLKKLIAISECNVILVTPENLNTYILEEHPLHSAYKYLSETHRSDYLRIYFMNFYGGGYSDIKEPSDSWSKSFDDLYNSNYWICGFKEKFPHDIGWKPYSNRFEELVGTSAFIAKPNTPLINEVYSEMIGFLDRKLLDLKMNPAKSPQDSSEKGTGYPIGWVEMLGKIYHKISYKYKSHLLHTLPRPITENYR